MSLGGDFAARTRRSVDGAVMSPVSFADDDEDYADDGLKGLAEGPLVITPGGNRTRPNGQTYRTRTINGMEDVAFLRAMRDRKRHVLFYGPPGTGKTAMAEASYFEDAVPLGTEDSEALLAKAHALGVRIAPRSPEYLHLGFESLVCGVDTETSDFFGTFTPNPDTGAHEFWAGPLLRAVLFSIPMYVDEIFLCDTRVLVPTLFPVMDGRGVLQVALNPRLPAFRVGDGFFVVGAGNPDVPGADYSPALRSRFPHQILVGTDWTLASELKVPRRVVTAAKRLDKLRKEGVISCSPQLRELIDYRIDMNDCGEQFALSALMGKTPIEDRDVTAAELKKQFPTLNVEALELGERVERP